jgi:hypothetical protein
MRPCLRVWVDEGAFSRIGAHELVATIENYSGIATEM